MEQWRSHSNEDGETAPEKSIMGGQYFEIDNWSQDNLCGEVYSIGFTES